MTRVVLIGHEASRTGAPLVLLEWGKWLRDAGHRVEFLMLRGGALVDDYRGVAPTRVLPRALTHPKARTALHLWLRTRYASFDLAWANTISVGGVAAGLAAVVPVVTHVHELPYVVRTVVRPRDLASALDATSAWVAVSPGVQSMLEGLGVPAQSITVVSGMTRLAGSPFSGSPRPSVGASGTMDWRKGADAFLQVAQRLRGDALEFLWMGGNELDRGYQGALHDIERMGLENVRLLGQVKDVVPFYSSIGVFLVTSREDPFPLVMLEAAASAVPIVAFCGGGGAAEFVEASGGGIAVPYLDLDAMAAAVRELMGDVELRRRCAEMAREHVQAHHRPDQVFPRLAEVLEGSR